MRLNSRDLISVSSKAFVIALSALDEVSPVNTEQVARIERCFRMLSFLRAEASSISEFLTRDGLEECLKAEGIPLKLNELIVLTEAAWIGG